MKKTFTTIMPDQMGAFLKAVKCIENLHLNITRVSYNKAIDMHMLFIEVEGDDDVLKKAGKMLKDMGYLDNEAVGNVMLVEFKLRDKPGELLPVLQLIYDYKFNISYISSQENGSEYQYFKMGLFIDDSDKVSSFLHNAALLCPVNVLEYNKHEKVLDNTVFYLNFAEEISEIADLSDEEKSELIVCSNQIMQMLDDTDKNAYKTFEFIGKFAQGIYEFKGEKFNPRITRYRFSKINAVHIEPQSGSSLFVFDFEDSILCVDSSFSCYKQELLKLLRSEINDFDRKHKTLLLTHADVDHVGNADIFDEVYCSENVYINCKNEIENKPAWREENPIHEPYVKISKILSSYELADISKFNIIGGRDPLAKQPLVYIGKFSFGPLSFDIYEGIGGHIKGEIIAIENALKIAFTGDIWVNIKGFTKEQASFNMLAPYLMTNVDTNPNDAKAERESFKNLLTEGKWYIFGGHGAMLEIEK